MVPLKITEGFLFLFMFSFILSN